MLITGHPRLHACRGPTERGNKLNITNPWWYYYGDVEGVGEAALVHACKWKWPHGARLKRRKYYDFRCRWSVATVRTEEAPTTSHIIKCQTVSRDEPCLRAASQDTQRITAIVSGIRPEITPRLYTITWESSYVGSMFYQGARRLAARVSLYPVGLPRNGSPVVFSPSRLSATDKFSCLRELTED